MKLSKESRLLNKEYKQFTKEHPEEFKPLLNDLESLAADVLAETCEGLMTREQWENEAFMAGLIEYTRLMIAYGYWYARVKARTPIPDVYLR